MTETLFGGECDGVEVPANGEPRWYSGRIGTCRYNVYVRGEDGKLRFSERVVVILPQASNTVSINVTFK